MEQDKKAQPQQTGTGAENATSPEQGRRPDAPEQSRSEQSSDISHVDQQEGQMNNGELGGNFNADSTDKA